ncbi:MAG: aspartate-semialdehyde dehydrogenase [Microvirga sp.]|nr:aspartate-semialdehyde dehydrogenase [Microvirga sp.]
MGFKIAVVGATGNVGREMLSILAERAFPADEVVALASRRSQGSEVSYGDKILKTKTLDTYDFSDVDICLMSAGGEVSKEWSPKIAAQGAVVIDNSSAWRYDQDVPLVVPEVNAEALREIKKGIVANPNCSTAQLVVALKPLHDRATIKRVVVATYQSVSGAGKDGMEGRVEDGGRDQEDARSEDQAHRHLRARAGLHRPLGSRERGIREPDQRRRGP